MDTNAELRQQLTKLKLSGVLESLEARLLECQQNQIDYKTFLKMVPNAFGTRSSDVRSARSSG